MLAKHFCGIAFLNSSAQLGRADNQVVVVGVVGVNKNKTRLFKRFLAVTSC